MAPDLKAGREIVRGVFKQSFSDKRFSKWNGVVQDNLARDTIRSVGKGNAISVEKFITDLS
jgi:hypothetical protein